MVEYENNSPVGAGAGADDVIAEAVVPEAMFAASGRSGVDTMGASAEATAAGDAEALER